MLRWTVCQSGVSGGLWESGDPPGSTLRLNSAVTESARLGLSKDGISSLTFFLLLFLPRLSLANHFCRGVLPTSLVSWVTAGATAAVACTDTGVEPKAGSGLSLALLRVWYRLI